MSVSQRVARGGLLAGLAALLQLCAGFFPGPGHVLSMFGTLPIYLLARSSAVEGSAGLIAATVIVTLLQPLEAPILLLLTGPLGLAYGLCERAGWRRIWSIAAAGATLTAGMLLLTYGIGMPAFGSLVSARNPLATAGGFALFALAYATLWSLVFARCRRWLLTVGSARAYRTGRRE